MKGERYSDTSVQGIIKHNRRGFSYIKLAIRFHFFLLQRYRPESPSSRIEIPLHDAAFHLGDDAVVAGGELDSGHLGDT